MYLISFVLLPSFSLPSRTSSFPSIVRCSLPPTAREHSIERIRGALESLCANIRLYTLLFVTAAAAQPKLAASIAFFFSRSIFLSRARKTITRRNTYRYTRYFLPSTYTPIYGVKLFLCNDVTVRETPLYPFLSPLCARTRAATCLCFLFFVYYTRGVYEDSRI